MAENSIREPARVGDLVDCVHVLSGHIHGRIARTGEQVVQEVPEEINVFRLRVRRVPGLGFSRERVVRIKLTGRAAGPLH